MKASKWLSIAGLLYLGILATVLLRAVARYAWIVAHGIRTEMAPTIGLLTAPLLALEIFVAAAVIESIIGYFDRRERPGWHYILIGVSYCSLLALAISVPIGVGVVLVVNPVTARWVLQLHSMRKQHP